MSQAPQDKADLTKGDAIRTGTLRPRVDMELSPDKVAMLLRLYEEADKDGNILNGHDNPNQKLYHLPALTSCPMDYWLSESVLGHVRLKPVPKINGQDAHRYYKEQCTTDKRNLINDLQDD